MDGYSISTVVLAVAAVLALIVVVKVVKLLVKIAALVVAVALGVAAWQVYAHRSDDGAGTAARSVRSVVTIDG